MSKRFYIVVPYNPISDKQKNFFKRLFELFKTATIIKMKEDMFQKRRLQLFHRIDYIISGLASIGLNAVQLDTQGMIELYYNTYNPRTSDNQKLADIRDLRVVR
jgi:hypothetical protein